MQLLNDLKDTRRYWKLKEKALHRAIWKTHCGGGYGHVVKTDYMMMMMMMTMAMMMMMMTTTTMMMMAVTPVGLTSSTLKIEAIGSSEALNIKRGYSRSLVKLPYTILRTEIHTVKVSHYSHCYSTNLAVEV